MLLKFYTYKGEVIHQFDNAEYLDLIKDQTKYEKIGKEIIYNEFGGENSGYLNVEFDVKDFLETFNNVTDLSNTTKEILKIIKKVNQKTLVTVFCL